MPVESFSFFCLRDCLFYSSKLLGFVLFLYVLKNFVDLFRKDFK